MDERTLLELAHEQDSPEVRNAALIGGVLAILPDSIRNYMTKFVSDDWMRELGFMD